MRRLTTEEFIKRAKEVHGNKYDYSKVEYNSANVKVCIICPKHGEFWQTPDMHLRGHGCFMCKGDEISKKKKFYKEGYVFFNKLYGFYILKSRLKGKRIIVKFLKTGFETECSINAARENNVKDPLSPILFGVGYLGIEASKIKNISKEKSYRKWSDMLRRCYDKNTESNGYKNCKVCDEWHNFSVFKEWFDKNYIDGYELDKDVFSNGNKYYSPNTCCFIPMEINRFLSSLTTSGKYKNGVTFNKCNRKFTSAISINGKRKHLGCFESEEEAYEIYKKEKIKQIKSIADKYKSELSEEIYNAIINKSF